MGLNRSLSKKLQGEGGKAQPTLRPPGYGPVSNTYVICMLLPLYNGNVQICDSVNTVVHT